MKKKVLLVFAIGLMFFIVAVCRQILDRQICYNITPRIIDEGRQIYTYDYIIYHKNGNIIKKDTHYGSPPVITNIGDNILEILERAGTDIFFCTYIDINNDRISKVYETPLGTGFGQIVFSKGVYNPYILIVSDIFDEEKRYEEFKIKDIADVLSPFDEVRFLDKNTLLIKYELNGENGEKTVVLNLRQ